jgi:hypothetical protein
MAAQPADREKLYQTDTFSTTPWIKCAELILLLHGQSVPQHSHTGAAAATEELLKLLLK